MTRPLKPINDFVGNGKAIAHILCRLNEFAAIDMIVIAFEGGERLTYGINLDFAELARRTSPKDVSKFVALDSLFPQLSPFRGEYLVWTWEMTNQQSYFDALQLELTNQTVIQFKTNDSAITVNQVVGLGDGSR